MAWYLVKYRDNSTSILQNFFQYLGVFRKNASSSAETFYLSGCNFHSRWTDWNEMLKHSNSVTIKLNLSLRLTKYHAMKTYAVLNKAPHHEDIWWSGGIAPRILNLGTRWRWVGSLTTPPLYPLGNSQQYPLDRSLGGPQSRSGRGGEEKESLACLCRESNHGRPDPSLVTVVTELPCLHLIYFKRNYFKKCRVHRQMFQMNVVISNKCNFCHKGKIVPVLN
jgi:hypothetical protein